MWQSQTAVSKIEQAKVDHQLRGLFRLAEVLRIDIADLFPDKLDASQHAVCVVDRQDGRYRVTVFAPPILDALRVVVERIAAAPER